jgi:branched-chain amino acid transport system permease protein
MRGPTGRVIVAIRDRPVAASSVGVDTAMYKSVTFGLSAMFTGIAGALGAMAVQFVGPDSFGVFLSITLLVGVVVGGLASISGAVYGALFIQFVPNLADAVSKAAPSAVYGIVLILFVYLMPRGVAGLVRRISTSALAARLSARSEARRPASVSPGTPVTQTKEGS